MLFLTARAIRTGDAWVIRVPSRRLHVIVEQLCDTDRSVGAALTTRSQSTRRPVRVAVEITAFVDLDDCSPAERQSLDDLVSARGSRPHALPL